MYQYIEWYNDNQIISIIEEQKPITIDVSLVVSVIEEHKPITSFSVIEEQKSTKEQNSITLSLHKMIESVLLKSRIPLTRGDLTNNVYLDYGRDYRGIGKDANPLTSPLRTLVKKKIIISFKLENGTHVYQHKKWYDLDHS